MTDSWYIVSTCPHVLSTWTGKWTIKIKIHACASAQYILSLEGHPPSPSDDIAARQNDFSTRQLRGPKGSLLSFLISNLCPSQTSASRYDRASFLFPFSFRTVLAHPPSLDPWVTVVAVHLPHHRRANTGTPFSPFWNLDSRRRYHRRTLLFELWKL